jgi:PTHB1 C-terminus
MLNLTIGGSEGGSLLTGSAQFTLPLASAVRLVPPVKAATYKLTLDTNRGPVSLLQLFADVAGVTAGSATDDQVLNSLQHMLCNQWMCYMCMHAAAPLLMHAFMLHCE